MLKRRIKIQNLKHNRHTVEKPLKYQKITAARTDSNEDNDSFPEIEKTNILRVRLYVPFDDEEKKALVYGQLQVMGFDIQDVKEETTTAWEENIFYSTTGYIPAGRDAKVYQNTTKSEEIDRDKNFYEVMARFTGYTEEKLRSLGKEYVEKELFKNGKTMLSDPIYRQARIEEAISRDKKYFDEKVAEKNEKISSLFEKNNDKWEVLKKKTKQVFDIQKAVEKLEKEEKNQGLDRYYGGPFIILDPKFWKDQWKKLKIAVQNMAAVIGQLYIEKQIKNNKEEIEKTKQERNELYDEARETIKEKREEEKDKINEEVVEEKEKDKLIQKAINEAKKESKNNPDDYIPILINKLTKIKTQLEENKQQRIGGFAILDEERKIDGDYKEALATLDDAMRSIAKEKNRLLRKSGSSTNDIKDLDERRKKLEQERARLQQNKFEEKWGDKETRQKRVRSIKEDNYLKSLGKTKIDENQGISFYSIQNMVNDELDRVAKLRELSKDEKEDMKNISNFVNNKERELAKAKASNDKTTIEKIENEIKNAKQTLKDIVDEREGSKKITREIRREVIIEEPKQEIKEARREEKNVEPEAPKTPLKAYHTVWDEQNMIDDLIEKGMSREEAKAKTEAFYQEFDKQQREKEAKAFEERVNLKDSLIEEVDTINKYLEDMKKIEKEYKEAYLDDDNKEQKEKAREKVEDSLNLINRYVDMIQKDDEAILKMDTSVKRLTPDNLKAMANNLSVIKAELEPMIEKLKEEREYLKSPWVVVGIEDRKQAKEEVKPLIKEEPKQPEPKMEEAKVEAKFQPKVETLKTEEPKVKVQILFSDIKELLKNMKEHIEVSLSVGDSFATSTARDENKEEREADEDKMVANYKELLKMMNKIKEKDASYDITVRDVTYVFEKPEPINTIEYGDMKQKYNEIYHLFRNEFRPKKDRLLNDRRKALMYQKQTNVKDIFKKMNRDYNHNQQVLKSLEQMQKENKEKLEQEKRQKEQQEAQNKKKTAPGIDMSGIKRGGINGL